MTIPKVHHHNLSALMIIVLIFILKYLISLYLFSTKFSLYVDEAQYWLWSQNLEWGYYSKPPLIALVIRCFTHLFGNGEIVLKIIPNLCVAISSWFIFKLATDLFSPRIGIISILIFLTMPIVIFGSFFVTTDPLLILCWSTALYLLNCALVKNTTLYWILFGLISGLGFLAKYAFIYFYLCLFCYLFFFDKAKIKQIKIGFLCSILITLALLTPNIYWNISNGMMTFNHIAQDNIKLQHQVYNPLKILSFILEQAAIMGIFNFIAILTPFFKKTHLDKKKQQLLYSFSLPIFVILASQAFFNRSNANWTAPAFVSISILTAYYIKNFNFTKLYKASLSLGITCTLGLIVLSTDRAMQWKNNPFNRIYGWRQVASLISKDHCDVDHILLFDNRTLAAEFLYYLRDCHPNAQYYSPSTKPTNYYHYKYPFTFNKNYLYFTNNHSAIKGYNLMNSLSYAYDNVRVINLHNIADQ
jgi:4-amino-4-deoxy-L-arabinose transferase-like glycosyltransferase